MHLLDPSPDPPTLGIFDGIFFLDLHVLQNSKFYILLLTIAGNRRVRSLSMQKKGMQVIGGTVITVTTREGDRETVYESVANCTGSTIKVEDDVEKRELSQPLRGRDRL